MAYCQLRLMKREYRHSEWTADDQRFRQKQGLLDRRNFLPGITTEWKPRRHRFRGSIGLRRSIKDSEGESFFPYITSRKFHDNKRLIQYPNKAQHNIESIHFNGKTKSQPINSKIKSLLPEANPFPAEDCNPLFVDLKKPNRRSLPFKTAQTTSTKL